MREFLKLWLKPKNVSKLLGIAILAWLFYKVDWPRLLAVLRTVNPRDLGLAMVLMVVSVSLKAFRWRYMLHGVNVHISALEALRVYYDAFFIGLITPGRLGEVIKAFYLQRERGLSLSTGFMSVVVDRLQDIAALLGICTVGGVLYLEEVGPLPALVTGGPFLVLVGIMLFPRFLMSRVAMVARRLATLPRLGRLAWFDWDGFGDIAHRSLNLMSWLMTLLSYAGFVFVAYFLALALGIELHPVYLAWCITTASLLSLLPITVSGVGTREAVVVAFFGARGYGVEVALAYGFLIFVACYLQFALWGFLVWIAAPIPLTPELIRGKPLDEEAADAGA